MEGLQNLGGWVELPQPLPRYATAAVICNSVEVEVVLYSSEGTRRKRDQCYVRGNNRNAYGILVGKPKGKNRYEDLGVDGSTILKWVLNRAEGHG